MSVPSVDEHGTRRASKRDQRGVRNFGRLLLFIAACLVHAAVLAAFAAVLAPR